MKICFISPETLPIPATQGGAIQRWIEEVSSKLNHKYKIMVICPTFDKGCMYNVIDNVEYHYIYIHPLLRIKPLNFLFRGGLYFLNVRKILKKNKCDIEHYHNRPAGVYISRLGINRKNKVILSLHNRKEGWNFFYCGLDSVLYNQGFAYCDNIVCVSKFTLNQFILDNPIYTDKSIYIYNGVDINSFKHQKSIKRSNFIIYIGRIIKIKGIENLIDTFNIINKKHPDFKLLIIGPFVNYSHQNLDSFSKKIIKKIKENPNIIIKDPIYSKTDLVKVISKCYVGILPSTKDSQEAFGMTLLEFNACGLPVIGSNVGGINEVIVDNKTGLFFISENTNDLVKKINRLIENKKLYNALKNNTRKHSIKFSWNNTSKKLIKVYKSLNNC